MSLPNGTKWLFAQTLRQMLLTRSFRQIKITDLCAACGADRQTFYYHFKDKYDLVAWVYEQTFQGILRKSGGVFRFEEMVMLLKALQEDRAFYRKVFDDHSQNALPSYIQQVNQAYVRTILLRESQTATLPDETEFAIRFYCYARIGCWKEWIMGESSYSAEEYARLLYAHSRLLGIPNEPRLLHN